MNPGSVVTEIRSGLRISKGIVRKALVVIAPAVSTTATNGADGGDAPVSGETAL